MRLWWWVALAGGIGTLLRYAIVLDKSKWLPLLGWLPLAGRGFQTPSPSQPKGVRGSYPAAHPASGRGV